MAHTAATRALPFPAVTVILLSIIPGESVKSSRYVSVRRKVMLRVATANPPLLIESM